MNRLRIKALFVLGFRVSIFSALFFLPLCFLLMLFWMDFITAFWVAFSLSLLVMGLTYYIQMTLLKKRFTMLSIAFENIANKQFEEQHQFRFKKQDELDYLLLQSAKTSLMVEKEIQRLNRMENYRKEFIGDISHELKTPIFAVQGFLETLLNGALEDPKVNRDFLNKAMRNVQRLTFLTKDLMEISKLETGELKSMMQNIYINPIIHEVIESLQYKARAENISISFKEDEKNLIAKADKHQIRQVIINLVENAIKYNKPNGQVIIELGRDTKQQNKVRITVRDTGIGIDEADLSRVTERFFRVDKSRSRERGGTGLGLAIVKHIIEAHNEKLELESTPNVGTSFSFTLKRAEYISA